MELLKEKVRVHQSLLDLCLRPNKTFKASFQNSVRDLRTEAGFLMLRHSTRSQKVILLVVRENMFGVVPQHQPSSQVLTHGPLSTLHNMKTWMASNLLKLSIN